MFVDLFIKLFSSNLPIASYDSPYVHAGLKKNFMQQATIPHFERPLLERTASSLKAIAHPVRLAMIDLLKDGRRMNVTEIYTALNLEQAVASQHLSILKDRDILASKRQGKHSYYFLKHPEIVDIIGFDFRDLRMISSLFSI